MKFILPLILIMLTALTVSAQVTPPITGDVVAPPPAQNDTDKYPNVVADAIDPEPDTNPYMLVEEPPMFPGGDSAWRAFVNNSIRYPQMAKEQGIQGNVYVRFVVERDGSITNVEVLKHPNSKDLANEARRIVMISPKWTPGKQGGKVVRTAVVQPIRFRLN
jgi:protein TonB